MSYDWPPRPTGEFGVTGPVAVFVKDGWRQKGAVLVAHKTVKTYDGVYFSTTSSRNLNNRVCNCSCRIGTCFKPFLMHLASIINMSAKYS